ncbi:MAG: lysoplasmalogenase [Myxococcales bacterium]|nr:lysoplasmalogenase [Myxococcales bacterium]
MILTLVCAWACAVLVAAEYARLRTLRMVAKSTASAAFVALGALLYDGDRYALLVLVGLVFGAGGDVALLGRSNKAFLAGLTLFLIGHLGYVAAFASLMPAGEWFAGAGPLVVAPYAAGGVVLWLLWPKLGAMKVPVIFYVLTIATMVAFALSAWRTEALPEPARTRMIVGAVLFFASDLAVARDRFVAATFANKAWGLPAYYAAQLFIAWSLA